MVPPYSTIPGWSLPEITLRAPGSSPPIVLPLELKIKTPAAKEFAMATLPVTSVPM